MNADAQAANEPNPAYEARLIPAPAGGTQNVGFLVKTSRVRIDAVSQERASETFINPVNGEDETLHDRPPLVLRATVDPNGLNPRPVIVVVNHTRSFIDIELVTGEGVRVRAKRTAQAESIASLLQELQIDNPGIPIISIGDYNAFQFNDGYTDPIAILEGAPTPDDQLVVDQSPDLVEPNFTNLTHLLPADQRYSFIFQGTPQVLDHMLVNSAALPLVQRYAIARGNADFPESALFVGDATRPERSSDHDMPVAYLKFPPTTQTLYFAGVGEIANPPTLLLTTSAPTGPTFKYKDSHAVNFSGGNQWKAVGTWTASPSLSKGLLRALEDAHVWLGLKNTDDIGTRFDLRVEVTKNGSTLIGAGETYCLQGITRNPTLAKEALVSFGPTTPSAFNGSDDVLSIAVLTRIGTNGSGSFCGGHSNATGLRLYFDSGTRQSRFKATF